MVDEQGHVSFSLVTSPAVAVIVKRETGVWSFILSDSGQGRLIHLPFSL